MLLRIRCSAISVCAVIEALPYDRLELQYSSVLALCHILATHTHTVGTEIGTVSIVYNDISYNVNKVVAR